MDLLNKTRRISKILQKNVGHHLVNFDEVAEALSDVISSNVYVINPEGKLLGYAIHHETNEDQINNTYPIEQFQLILPKSLWMSIKPSRMLEMKVQMHCFRLK